MVLRCPDEDVIERYEDCLSHKADGEPTEAGSLGSFFIPSGAKDKPRR